MPFGFTNDEAEQYQVLVEGVPAPLREAILGWLRPILSSSDYSEVYNARAIELSMLTRINLGVREDDFLKWTQLAQLLRKLPEEELLRLVDAALSKSWRRETAQLESALSLSKSKWKVGSRLGARGLVSRVPEGVQSMVESTIANSGTAGQILARAWGKVHAITPDNSGAYADAVRAAETAIQPVVEPRNKEATLGTLASVMKAQGDWRLPLREHQHTPSSDLVPAMLRTLFRGQADRHGTADYRDVTHEEAETGVVLAATLVAWFASGAVQRRSE